MLDAGADPLIHLPTSPLTAMTRAVKNGHVGTVQLFIERGFAIPAWVTISGRSHPFLKVAADNGHLPVVQLIIGNKDGVLPWSGHWGEIIGSAAERGHFSVVKALVEVLWGEIRYDDLRLEKKCLAEALCMAVGANQMEIVQYFVQHFVQLGVGLDTDYYGFAAPLSAAASKGHLDMLRYILAHGSNVNRISVDRSNHFYRASAAGQGAAVKLMLEHLDPAFLASRDEDE